MRTLIARPQRVAPPNYSAAAVADYESWRDAYAARHPTITARMVSAAIIRRIVMLHRAGDSWSEIARCCGISCNAPKIIYERLPDALR